MDNQESIRSWKCAEDLFFSDALTAYMHSINVRTFGDLLDRMSEVIDMMEQDNRVDLVPEFTLHLQRLEDMMDFIAHAKGNYKFVPPEIIRGQPLVDLGFSSGFLSALADFHVYTIGALIDTTDQWVEMCRSFKNDKLKEEFVDCLKRVAASQVFASRNN